MILLRHNVREQKMNKNWLPGRCDTSIGPRHTDLNQISICLNENYYFPHGMFLSVHFCDFHHKLNQSRRSSDRILDDVFLCRT